MGKSLRLYFDNRQWLTRSYTFYIALITMIIIPLNVRYLPPFMILWGVIWLFENRSRFDKILKVDKSHLLLFFLFSGLFVWQLIGMLYSDNPVRGWQNLNRRLSLILFPLVLIVPGEMIKQKIKLLLRLFAGSTFLFIVFCYFFAFYRSIDVQNGLMSFNPHQTVYWWLNYFYGTYFSVYQHPSYLSMYVLFSVFIALESIYDTTLMNKYRIGWGVIGLILMTSIYFLSSRTAMLASLIFIPFYFLYRAIKRKKFRFVWIIAFFGMIFLSQIILKNLKFADLTNAVSQDSFINTIKNDDRIIVWKAALEVVQKNLLFGVGTGDVNTELLRENIKEGNTALVENSLNAHNQYIETTLENGLIGLVLLLSILATMLYIAFKDKKLLYIVFIVIVMFFFLFESISNRLAGVTFFAMFSFLLIHLKNSET